MTATNPMPFLDLGLVAPAGCKLHDPRPPRPRPLGRDSTRAAVKRREGVLNPMAQTLQENIRFTPEQHRSGSEMRPAGAMSRRTNSSPTSSWTPSTVGNGQGPRPKSGWRAPRSSRLRPCPRSRRHRARERGRADKGLHLCPRARPRFRPGRGHDHAVRTTRKERQMNFSLGFTGKQRQRT